MSKIKKALALGFNKDKDNAPKLLAKGNDNVAQKIIELAKEHKIPIQEDDELCEVLSKLELGEEIPTNMYKAVAEVFSFIYKTSKKK
ncbi:EscU/YscU/HrcU family type III secretion system export apparatus switch protein [Campylobacter canadensis]|uniref:EscU/YscU/HrcU family type III secretion system export apparatus switch protein n=1 Tax=Campylobacter canadensis TaxID=449520 RepID=UPI0015561DF8|nr:EscU/YscU/HrcU family type III secretion system export apparatus switch protein [Campylobacter canadensis]MBZ7994510.1 EscU/YscU/HrcU family type III secretion system export apparatus switch protein [Campylobacter canadensis]MBZ7997197.1 EscU/YscU/HrcU family type III secretion system export apparatus switch protein [Campylobacter canadensis]MBZ7999775.1 EscU/YscU/HrcU family type III secretion system export apparatus switch protein [Campylobacter canadensis]MBZ8002537.1 EscU/YscU/HrcU famil